MQIRFKNVFVVVIFLNKFVATINDFFLYIFYKSYRAFLWKHLNYNLYEQFEENISRRIASLLLQDKIRKTR